MLLNTFSFLAAGFTLSEVCLAIWRRASVSVNTTDPDRGSLRLLWVIISASITAAVLLAIHGATPQFPHGFPGPAFGVTVFSAGSLLRWWSIWHLGRFFTVNVSLAADHRVVDTGPYRFVRHPSYGGLLLQFTGLGISLGNVPCLFVLLVPSIVAILYRIRLEEAALRAHLPSAYAEYSSRTKRIVPMLF